MPPGFGLLDAALVSVPVFLMLLGLIRGAAVELAACCGCAAGIAAAWLASCLPPIQALGQPGAPLAELGTGLAAWWVVCSLSHLFGFDTRWIDVGRLFDGLAGGALGAVRGLAVVSLGCLCHALIGIPLGLADPVQTASYPVFLRLGAGVTDTAMAATRPSAQSVVVGAVQPPQDAPVPAMPPALPTRNGPALAALIRAIAPSAEAAPTQPPPMPAPVPRVDSPVRAVPVALIETHHNILHPFGLMHRRTRH